MRTTRSYRHDPHLEDGKSAWLRFGYDDAYPALAFDHSGTPLLRKRENFGQRRRGSALRQPFQGGGRAFKGDFIGSDGSGGGAVA